MPSPRTFIPPPAVADVAAETLCMNPKLFLRFGKFSEGGKSRMGLGEEWTAELGSTGYEAGLSVIGLAPEKLDGKYLTRDPDAERALYGIPYDYIGNMVTNLHADAARRGEVYLVTGDLIPIRDRAGRHRDDQREQIKDEEDDLEEAIEDGDTVRAANLRRRVEQLKSALGWTYEVGADGEPVILNARKVKKISLSDVWYRHPVMTLQDLLSKRSSAPRHNPSERTFIPPQAVANEARLGLAIRAEQPPSNRCCTPVGLRRAVQLMNRQAVSVRTLKRMRSYFARHAVDARGAGWREDSRGWQAWLLWGGNAGRNWCNKVLNSLGE